MAVVGWIDPDLLEVKFEDCVCSLCAGVMINPTSGCHSRYSASEEACGRSFCRACYVKWRVKQKNCPTCRPVTAESLQSNHQLEGVISQLRLRCPHADGDTENNAAGSPAAKRAKLAPVASMTVNALRTELGQRALDSTGETPELVAGLEEDRTKNVACMWKGSVGELAAHLQECHVKCPHTGCTKSPLRRALAQHEATCEYRVVECVHCKVEIPSRWFAEHEGISPVRRLSARTRDAASSARGVP